MQLIAACASTTTAAAAAAAVASPFQKEPSKMSKTRTENDVGQLHTTMLVPGGHTHGLCRRSLPCRSIPSISDFKRTWLAPPMLDAHSNDTSVTMNHWVCDGTNMRAIECIPPQARVMTYLVCPSAPPTPLTVQVPLHAATAIHAGQAPAIRMPTELIATRRKAITPHRQVTLRVAEPQPPPSIPAVSGRRRS